MFPDVCPIRRMDFRERVRLKCMTRLRAKGNRLVKRTEAREMRESYHILGIGSKELRLPEVKLGTD